MTENTSWRGKVINLNHVTIASEVIELLCQGKSLSSVKIPLSNTFDNSQHIQEKLYSKMTKKREREIMLENQQAQNKKAKKEREREKEREKEREREREREKKKSLSSLTYSGTKDTENKKNNQLPSSEVPNKQKPSQTYTNLSERLNLKSLFQEKPEITECFKQNCIEFCQQLRNILFVYLGHFRLLMPKVTTYTVDLIKVIT